MKDSYQMLRSLMLTAVMICSSIVAFAQMHVTGTIVDDAGLEVIGASVLEKGTTNGTVTDVDGKFELNVAPSATLAISYVGYVSQEVKASAQMRVVLHEDSEVLDDVVVVGYGVQKKSSVTGAISSVKAGDIENRAITSATAALQGKTPGINVIQANKPGESPTIRVRGFSSNSDASPLYVVDGIRLDDISGIDPNDIQSMEILKDAASAAIYGAQAGNGVVLITTKKGKASANKWGTISFSYQLSLQSLAVKPQLLNASEYIQYESERLGMSVAEYTASAKEKGWDGKTDTDWYDAAFESSPMHKYSLSVQNATDKGSYYAAINYVYNDGIIKGSRDTYQRFTGKINADHKITSWLQVGTTNQFEKNKTQSVVTNVTGYSGNVITSVMHMDPLTRPTYAPDELIPVMQNALASGFTLLTDGDGNYYGVSDFSDDQHNPLILINQDETPTYGWNATGSAYANITPFEGFTFTSRFGYKLAASNSKVYNHKYYGYSTRSNNKISTSAQTDMTTYTQWENFVNYNKTIAQRHDISAMAGMSFSKNIYDYTKGSLSDSKGDAVLVDDAYGFIDLDNGIQSSDGKQVAGGQTVNTSTSYYGRMGYTYDNKYMLQLTFRADAYDLSKLPRDHRWGYFPAVSAGWTVTRESWMQSAQSWLNDLKVRGSWGQNGSISALQAYQYSANIGTGHPVAFYNNGTSTLVSSAYPLTMGNNDLTWETSEQLDFGVDARLLGDRLTFSFDWYQKKTKDLLVDGVILSLEQGGTPSPINAGNVENKGIELELGWQDHIGDFKYGIRGNLATLSNKVTYLHPSITRINGATCYNKLRTVFETGHNVWHYYGYVFDYIDEQGYPQFKDMNGDGIVSDDDKTDIGSAIPDFTYGLTLTASWKGLDLCVFGTGSYGNQVYCNYGREDGQPSFNKVKELFYDGRWTEGMAAGQASKPRASASQTSEYLGSSAMVYDASFFKIKQIQLGYTLPKQILSKVHAQNCRIYCSLDDFFTLTSYPGFDPEAAGGTGSAMGIDNGVYPSSRKVTFGINLSF